MRLILASACDGAAVEVTGCYYKQDLRAQRKMVRCVMLGWTRNAWFDVECFRFNVIVS